MSGIYCKQCGLVFPIEEGPICPLCGADMVPQNLANHWGGIHTPDPSSWRRTLGQMNSGVYDIWGRPYKAKPRKRKKP